MARTAIQLYTLREVDSSLDDLLEMVAAAGFDAVEFAGRETKYEPDEVVDMLARNGLEVAGAHVGIEDLEDDPDGLAERYEAMDCTNLICPGMDPRHFESQEGVATAAGRLEVVADALEDTDCTLHYHTHTQEFQQIEGGLAFEGFLAATDVSIELDVGHTLRAGEDPADWLRRLEGRAELVHFADVDVESDESVPLGEGDVDLAACAEAAAEIGADWYVYEYEGADPLTTIDDAAQKLMNLT
ncbi:xylose isomerase [Salinarchaeum sp. Harcht-Bsk1]|uniref:sugar phosphate isomerase/epimerase family protein n=1 Tax=Salinarchaeum sp. Harcht-Bsk1 TaxID=1333523 RepID=UPI0003422803|nr:sugar phosphate isomerase/epimerase [Salinarchaeum sp. Harcht-Bsk1]AGN02145.1 xylose isomerase [Salinarchaeum sp. Harcht-Bsk1]